MNSNILSGKQKRELIKVCEFEEKSKLSLLYRGSRDGFGGHVFHAKCDGKRNTLTIVKSTNGNIFGGFTGLAWNQSGIWINDPKTFLFRLVNQDNEFIKFNQNESATCIHSYSDRLTVFGYDVTYSPRSRGSSINRYRQNNSKTNLYIASDANINQNSFTDIGRIFSIQECGQGTDTHHFQVTEIEVFCLI